MTRTFYFLRLIPAVNGFTQSQLWAIVCGSKAGAISKLDALLEKQRTGTLTAEDLERAKAYPAPPERATLNQLRAARMLTKASKRENVRDFFHTATGPRIVRPERLPDPATARRTTQGSQPHPIQSGPAQDGATAPTTDHAHSNDKAEAGH